MPTLILLTLSNLFMTTAWYWHLRGGPEVANARPLGLVILASWLLAGIEYTLAVPANRIGYAAGWTPGQLKIAQEAIALTVFGVFMSWCSASRSAGVTWPRSAASWRRWGSCSSAASAAP